MSLSNAMETAILGLIFNATAIADLAQDDGSSPAANLFVALHVGDPGEAGNQSNNEAAYTNYTRIAVSRNAAGWTVSGNNVVNAANISFPACGATGNNITYFSIGVNNNADSVIIGSGTCNLNVSNGITPVFAAGNLSAVLE